MDVADVDGARAQIQRLIVSQTFEASDAHRLLLAYLAEQSLSGQADRLKEYTVGIEALHKPESYDPQQDSIVRAHTGRLRLKLREYYATEGKDDPIVVELPKGGFKLVFHRVAPLESHLAFDDTVDAVSPARSDKDLGPFFIRLPWVLSAVFATASLILGYWAFTMRASNLRLQQSIRLESSPQPPWPLSRVVNERLPTVVVGGDAGFAMLRVLNGRHGSLEEYLLPDFPNTSLPKSLNARESKLVTLLSTPPLVSYSTVQNVKTILTLAGPTRVNIAVKSAREFRTRDLVDGNYIIMGSPTSNPWVSLFEHFLNFQEVEDLSGSNKKYFLNRNPQAGELPRYDGIRETGATGMAYATVALVPNEQHAGNVLILQGLQQEGTEAGARFLACDECRTALQDSLRKLTKDPQQAWFEALIGASSMAGTPGKIRIVALRVVQ
jgi:hypothetical protein